MLIQAADPRISWQGAVTLQNLDGSVKPWRLDYHDLDFYYDPDLWLKGEMPSGVRLRFRTDASAFTLNFDHEVVYASVTAAGGMEEIPHCLLETFVNGKPFRLDDVPDDAGALSVTGLPGGMNDIEIYLPSNCKVVVHSLELTSAAVIIPLMDNRPRWVVLGSSITHCIRASSPSQTWPAIVAAESGWNLTSLGFGNQCRLEHSLAALVRDLPADIITLKLACNTLRDQSPRAFAPGVIGSIRTIREKHPVTPLIVCSNIYASTGSETTPSCTGQTGELMRRAIAEAVELFRKRGDRRIYYINGLKIFGAAESEKHQPDGVHPDAEGIRIMARNFLNELKQLNLWE
jgi:hypothetical protein